MIVVSGKWKHLRPVSLAVRPLAQSKTKLLNEAVHGESVISTTDLCAIPFTRQHTNTCIYYMATILDRIIVNLRREVSQERKAHQRD